jgi:hypothetical protein
MKKILSLSFGEKSLALAFQDGDIVSFPDNPIFLLFGNHSNEAFSLRVAFSLLLMISKLKTTSCQIFKR